MQNLNSFSVLLQTLRKSVYVIFLMPILLACFKYSPYETDLPNEHTAQTERELNQLAKQNQQGDSIVFAFIGDSQNFYDECERFVNKVNTMDDIEMTIIAGDITQYGIGEEFILVSEILGNLKKPFLTVLGNHDLLNNGIHLYQLAFGPIDYSFTYKGYKFIMLNSNGFFYDKDSTVPNIAWLDKELSDTANYKKAIVVGHIPPYHKHFHNELEIPFAQTLKKWKKTQLALNGHVHDFNISQPYGNDVTYIDTYSIGRKAWVKMTVWEDGFDLELVEL